MTWEWVTIIVSFQAFAIFLGLIAWTHIESKKIASPSIDTLEALKQMQSTLDEQLQVVDKIKADHERIERLAEETKKMLSTANLARGIGGHR
jgi:hypothetical protein